MSNYKSIKRNVKQIEMLIQSLDFELESRDLQDLELATRVQDIVYFVDKLKLEANRLARNNKD